MSGREDAAARYAEREAAKARRQRRMLRRVLIGLVVVAVVFVGLAGWELYGSLTAKPNIDTDYRSRLERMVAEGQPDGVDGAHALGEAARLAESIQAQTWETLFGVGGPFEDSEFGYDGYEAVSMYLELKQSIEFDWDPAFGEDHAANRAEAIAVLDAERAAFTAAIDAADDTGMRVYMTAVDEADRFVPRFGNGPLFSTTLSGSSVRDLMRLLGARLHLSYERRDWDAYTETAGWYLATTRGTDTAMGPWLISRLVTHASMAYFAEVFQMHAWSGELPPEVLRQVLAEIDANPLMPASEVFERERLVTLDTIQRVYDHRGRLILGGPDRVRSWQDDSEKPMVTNVLSITKPRRSEAEGVVDEWYERAVTLLGRDPGPNTSVREGETLSEITAPLGQPLGDTILVGDTVIERFYRAELVERGPRLLLGILIFHAEQGRYPTTLAELVPGVLNELPADPWSPTGATFQYRVLNQPDAYGREFLLYSVALDGEDDGGTEHPEHPFNAFRRDGEGTDFVINAVPEHEREAREIREGG